MELQQRFDSVLAFAQEEGKKPLGNYGEHFLRSVVLDSGINFDEDEAYTFSRSLETVWAREIEQPRAPLPLAQGDLLPPSPNVDEGSDTYRYYLISDQGDAQWSSSYSGTEMPTTSLSGAEMTGHIETIEGGYMVSRKQLRNARKGSVRLIPRNQTASVRAHLELWDEALAWGKESIGILGLFNHPLISVISAADKGGGATTWRGATVDQIVADVAALINSIPRSTNELLHATRVLMSPRLYDYCQQTRIGGDNGSLTILEHLVRIFSGAGNDDVVAPEFPVQFSTVRYLDASNPRSAGYLDSDALFAYIDNDDEVVCRVEVFLARAYPTQERGLMLETPQESEVGGVEVAQPLGLARMDGVFLG
jgi:hypothetical protein